jgi:tetratricopeptide (TPR) repeat protein
MDVYGFTGRDDQLAELNGLLAGDGSRTTVISAVAGTAGVGKTALAVHWAHQVAGRFPDGQLYIDLRGYDPEQPIAPADALAGFLRALGVDPPTIPGTLDERAANFRTLLSGRRVLVVLDNAYGADQVRPLLPGSPSCFAIVTSRDDLAGLVARDGARRIDLDTLTAEEAVTLLRTLIGPRVDESPENAAALAECCARLPLALRIAAELATAHATTSLDELLSDLDDERRRLDMLDASGDPRTAVRAVFSWSYQHLSEAGARVFSLLGLHPGREIDAYAVAALADVDLPRARALTAELSRAHLIEPLGAEGHLSFYGMHDLLRAYAIERADAVFDEDARRAALSRLFGFYLGAAAAAMDTLFPHERRARPRVPPPDTPVPAVGAPAAAAEWLDRQRPGLVAAAVHAARHGWPHLAVDLSRTLWRHFEVGGHYQDALEVHTAAAQAAHQEEYGQASVLTNLGGIHWWLGNHKEAQTYFEQSLSGTRESGDAEGEARALARLGLVHERLGEYGEALACMRGALSIYRRTGNRHGEGTQLVNLGTLHRRRGRYEEAAEHQRQAAAVFVEVGDARLEGYALGNLGAVCGLLGLYEEALTHLEKALANCRETGDPGGEGSALATIGGVYRRMERFPEAADHLHRALTLARKTGDRSLEIESLNMLGETLFAMRQPGPAIARHRAALALTADSGDRFEHARALDGIAQVLASTGQDEAARDHWSAALVIYEELGVPEADRIRGRLAD